MKEILFMQFTGTKTVDACKMSRKAAEEIIGRKVRPDSDEIEDEHGYFVRYPDGYTSWSPLKAFEDVYRVSETHIDRMKIEKEEVEKRYLEGKKFSFSEKYSSLDNDQRLLLRRQLDQMENYLYTLRERIDYEQKLEKDKNDARDLAMKSYGCKASDSMSPLDMNGGPAEPLRSKHD